MELKNIATQKVMAKKDIRCFILLKYMWIKDAINIRHVSLTVIIKCALITCDLLLK